MIYGLEEVCLSEIFPNRQRLSQPDNFFDFPSVIPPDRYLIAINDDPSPFDPCYRFNEYQKRFMNPDEK